MEIEKKFTIKKIPDHLEQYPCKKIEQGYLCVGPVIRIRRSNEDYILTYKSKGNKQEEALQTKVNEEIEMPLSQDAYEHLKTKIDGKLIEKERYIIPLEEGLKAELDIFHGYLEGLHFVEVEFPTIEDALAFEKPDWFDQDVSMDRRYANNYLSRIDHWE